MPVILLTAQLWECGSKTRGGQTCLFQICRGLDPMLYMTDRNPDWYAFLNIVKAAKYGRMSVCL